MRGLVLADSNHAGMEKVYYYSIMTKQCIEITISDIDYNKLLPDINSTANICNMSYEKSYEEESSPNDYTDYSENICSK